MLTAVMAVMFAFATDAAAQEPPPPKWELFGGYSFFAPAADVHGELPGALLPLSSRLESNPRGVGLSATYDFNRWFGLTLDASTHWGSGESTLFNRLDDAAFSNLSLGPKFTFRTKHFSPFVEVLIGDHRLMPDAFHDIDKLGLMFGGGLDINLSRHVALRLIRADYVYSNYQYGSASVTPRTEIRGLRAQVGINFMFGGGAPSVSPSASCLLQPAEVFAGERVDASASEANFHPRRSVAYHWHGTGVKAAGNNASTQVETAGLAPGSYVVTADLTDGTRGGSASCSSRFTVKENHPPVIACSADPASVQTGGTSRISSNASSPDGRRVAYSYTATAGDISGDDSSETLNTRGAEPGRVTVTCNARDDRDPPLTASSTTTVDVEAPPPPPPPAPAPEIKELEARLELHSIYFQTARPNEENPNGGLLPSQEQILITLAEDYRKYLKYRPDAHLILGGHADQRGSAEYNKSLTERRVERTKQFLIAHDIPAGHIETRSFGDEQALNSTQVREQIAQNPDLTPADRQQMLGNLRVMVLANNRRVDVSLNTTGQQSTHRYPFNARDYLALISTKGGEKKTPPKKKPEARGETR
jgi:outer membrane protein OmpA-like peptidoglycan-associated protein/opacity protein-like surface antigen